MGSIASSGHKTLIDGERLLSVEVGVVSFLGDKPLAFHDAISSVSPSLFKV